MSDHHETHPAVKEAFVAALAASDPGQGVTERAKISLDCSLTTFGQDVPLVEVSLETFVYMRLTKHGLLAQGQVHNKMPVEFRGESRAQNGEFLARLDSNDPWTVEPAAPTTHERLTKALDGAYITMQVTDDKTEFVIHDSIHKDTVDQVAEPVSFSIPLEFDHLLTGDVRVNVDAGGRITRVNENTVTTLTATLDSIKHSSFQYTPEDLERMKDLPSLAQFRGTLDVEYIYFDYGAVHHVEVVPEEDISRDGPTILELVTERVSDQVGEIEVARGAEVEQAVRRGRELFDL